MITRLVKAWIVAILSNAGSGRDGMLNLSRVQARVGDGTDFKVLLLDQIIERGSTSAEDSTA